MDKKTREVLKIDNLRSAVCLMRVAFLKNLLKEAGMHHAVIHAQSPPCQHPISDYWEKPGDTIKELGGFDEPCPMKADRVCRQL
ncbi:hypothetical protein [Pseudomonas serbica]